MWRDLFDRACRDGGGGDGGGGGASGTGVGSAGDQGDSPGSTGVGGGPGQGPGTGDASTAGMSGPETSTPSPAAPGTGLGTEGIFDFNPISAVLGLAPAFGPIGVVAGLGGAVAGMAAAAGLDVGSPNPGEGPSGGSPDASGATAPASIIPLSPPAQPSLGSPAVTPLPTLGSFDSMTDAQLQAAADGGDERAKLALDKRKADKLEADATIKEAEDEARRRATEGSSEVTSLLALPSDTRLVDPLGLGDFGLNVSRPTLLGIA